MNKKWDERAYKLHIQTLKNVKACIDNKIPKKFSPIKEGKFISSESEYKYKIKKFLNGEQNMLKLINFWRKLRNHMG